MPDNSMYVEPVIAVNADISGVQNPSMYKPVTVVNMPSSPTSGVTSVNGQTGAVTLNASDVGALPSSTVIPSGEDLVPAHSSSDNGKVLGVNSSGNTEWVTAGGGGTQVQANWTESDPTALSYIQNKPTLATVATSGSYNDLANKPSIPAAQVQSDYAQTDSSAVDYIKNKPTLFSGDYNDLTNKPDLSIYAESSDLATVATSGSYNDLSNKPSIPAAQVNSDWNASSGVAEILNKPTLAAVATSGSYNDLSNTPTINNVPTVTSSDDGKVLTASYSGGVASYSWAAGGSGSESVKVLEINNANIYDSAVTASIVQFVKTYAADYPIIINHVVNKGQSTEHSNLYYLSNYVKENSQGISGDYPEFSLTKGYDYQSSSRYITYMFYYPQDDGEGNIYYVTGNETDYFDYSGNSIFNYGTTSLNAYQLEEVFNGGETQNKHIFFFVSNTDFSAADQALLFSNGTEANIMLDGLQLIKDTSTLEFTAAKFYGIVDGVTANSKYMITATFDYSSDPWLPGTKTLTVQDLSASGGQTYTAGNMISISSNTIGVSTTAGITDIQVVNSLPASPVSTVLYLIPET